MLADEMSRFIGSRHTGLIVDELSSLKPESAETQNCTTFVHTRVVLKDAIDTRHRLIGSH
jgi:hypothetical protein